MRDLAVLFLHLLATVARLAGPGGARSVVAESVLAKHLSLPRIHSPAGLMLHRSEMKRRLDSGHAAHRCTGLVSDHYRACSGREREASAD